MLFIFANTVAQKGFEITEAKKAVIHFQFINNLILIPVNLNGVNLTFLLDSGVNETILFSLDDKQIDFNQVEKVKFAGLGENLEIEGLRAENNVVNIGKNFTDDQHKLYIILDERINFSSHVGIPVNGIIGYHFFKDHQVEINYNSKKITIHPSIEKVEKRIKRYTKIPISIEKYKPYLIAGVEMTAQNVPSKLLLDLGNSDAVWLFPKLIPNFQYNRPNIDDFLGRGFNGDIFGKRSRIHRLYLDDYVFEKPLTAMPDEYSIQNLKLVPDRKGSIGNEILRRFNIIFDYPNSQIYIKKNKHFNDPFLFNNSGLDVQHNGMSWEKDMVTIQTKKNDSNNEGTPVFKDRTPIHYNFVLKQKFSVAGCRKDSPCYIAGIRKNDEIISINRRKVGDLTLQNINNYFKAKEGTPIHLEIERKGKIQNFVIILVDPIPYRDEN